MTAIDPQYLQARWNDLRTKFWRGITAYHINLLRRLCSVTSPGGVSKSAPRASTDERRISILFFIAMDSYRWVSQRTILSGGAQANFMIGINGGNGPQDSAEGTESMHGLLCDADEGGSCLGRRVFALPLRIWEVSGESKKKTC